MEKEILLEIIKRSGFSQKEFANKTNIPETRISEWVRGKRKPKLSTLVEALKMLNLKIKFEIVKTLNES